jgi:hypothetical protein
MAELPPGIRPNRDTDSRALQLDTFGIPSMPGSFNAIVADVSKRANTRIGTKAERDKAVADGEVYRGLTWMTLPDSTTVTEWTPRPVTWTGTYWDDPLMRGRGLFFPRSSFFSQSSVGVLGNTKTSVMKATWFNAPGGQYRIDFDFSMDGPTMTDAVSRDMTLIGTQNGKTLRADYLDDISPITRNYKYHALVNDHPGGDLVAELSVFINGTTGTLYTNGTSVMFQHLGPYLHG